MQESFYARLNPGYENLRETYPHQAIQLNELRYRGNTTLSIYPIEQQGKEGFVQDSPFTRVVIDVNGSRVAVYNVSLPAPIASGATNTVLGLLSNYYTAERDEALELLLERISRETLPMIVGGEFNISEFDVNYDRLIEYARDSFREAGTGLGFTFPAAGGYSLNGLVRPIMRLDYVWHDDNFRTLSAVVGDPVSIADRLPIMVQLDYLGQEQP